MSSGCDSEKSSTRKESIQEKTGSGSSDNWSCKFKTMEEEGFISCLKLRLFNVSAKL